MYKEVNNKRSAIFTLDERQRDGRINRVSYIFPSKMPKKWQFTKELPFNFINFRPNADVSYSSTDDTIDDQPSYYGLRYTCTFANCGLQFRRKDQLDSHEYTHSGIRKYPCWEDDCTKSYTNSAHLLRHQRTVHEASTKIILCTAADCPEFFDSTAKLKNHLLKVHNGEQREFGCDLCEKKFTRKSKLREHMFRHTGHFNYRCDICEKGFLQMAHLKRHIDHIHTDRTCDQCAQVFTKWSSLLAHKRTVHTTEADNKCTDCNRVFKSKCSLRNHSKVHAKQNHQLIYECTFAGCSKFFQKHSNMLAHYKSSHEERRFICTVDGCGRGLTTKQKLKYHMDVMHAKEGDATANNSVNKKKSTKAKNRAKRKDKGEQRVSTASKLFQIVLPKDFEQAIMAGDGHKINFHYDRDRVDPDEDEGDENRRCTEKTMAGVISKNAIKC